MSANQNPDTVGGLPPGGIGQSLLLPEPLFNILAPAFQEIKCELQSCDEEKEPDVDGVENPIIKPRHNCAVCSDTGEIVLLYVTKDTINDTTKVMSLNNIVYPFLSGAVGLYVFTDADDILKPYIGLKNTWIDRSKELRRAEFIPNPKIQDLKSLGNGAQLDRIKNLLRLEMLAGRFDQLSEEDKKYLVELINGQGFIAGGGIKAYLKALLIKLGLDSDFLYDLGGIVDNDSLTPANKIGNIINELIKKRDYPTSNKDKKGYTMLGCLVDNLSCDISDQRLVELIAKYRLITNRAKLAELQQKYSSWGIEF